MQLGATAWRRAGKIQAILGGVFLGVGALFAVLPFTGLPPGIAFGAIGPTIAGIVNLGVGLGFRGAWRRQPAVTLSDDARALLQALVVRAQAWQGGWAIPPQRIVMRPGHSERTPSIPPPGALEALEAAAGAHNRVVDALASATDERAMRLLAAADAGMGEALHLAATAREDRPKELDEAVARLSELADRVEAAVRLPDGPSPLRSALESTLEELRAEDQARRELRS